MSDDIPADFSRLRLRPNPYVDACGPLYGKREGELLVLGLRVEARHCNPAGSCHGGMMLTLADMLLVLGSSAQSGLHRYMVTVNLSCDFVAAAPEGSWLEGRMQVLRATRNLLFVQGLISCLAEPVARVSGIVKPSGEADEGSSFEGYLPGQGRPAAAPDVAA